MLKMSIDAINSNNIVAKESNYWYHKIENSNYLTSNDLAMNSTIWI